MCGDWLILCMNIRRDEKTIGVLLMAYGSPDSLDDMAAYLSDIRGGRPMSPEFVAEFAIATRRSVASRR